jgi:chromosome segregation ATPase
VTDALPFTDWRDEITVELSEAQVALAAATAELHAAETSLADAKVQHQALRDAVTVLRPPISSAIGRRVGNSDESVREAGNAVARARGAVTALRDRCADLEEGLKQLAQLVAPVAEAEVTSTEELADAT